MRTAAKIAILAVTALVLFFLFAPIKTERGLICRNTVSKTEYTEWLGGFRTDERYTESPIETYLREKTRAGLMHDWVSFRGTSKNLVGSIFRHSHGRPGEILRLGPETFSHIAALPDEQKDEIVAILRSRDQAAIAAWVRAIWEDILKR